MDGYYIPYWFKTQQHKMYGWEDSYYQKVGIIVCIILLSIIICVQITLDISYHFKLLNWLSLEAIMLEMIISLLITLNTVEYVKYIRRRELFCNI